MNSPNASSAPPIYTIVSTMSLLNISSSTVNSSSNSTSSVWKLQIYSEEHMVATSIFLGLFVLCCIIGNCFVIAAVILERSLHNVANYLILSLAVADLLVAVLVMPLSVVNEISKVNSKPSLVSQFFVFTSSKLL